MAKTGGADQFANLAVITVVESAANTLTFKKLETGISLFEKMAWIIARIEYDVAYGMPYFDAHGDQIEMALCATDQITSLGYANNAVIDKLTITRIDTGTPATSMMAQRPWTKDFSSLPGGGLIVPPNPLYAGAKGLSITAAMTVTLRLFYTNLQLSVDQYWELVEARRMISS
jgi:hypothetical protein